MSKKRGNVTNVTNLQPLQGSFQTFCKYLRVQATFRYRLARTNPESWYWLRHPTQSIMYVPLQVNRFLFYLSSSTILQNLILCTRSCCTGFITQSSWGFHFHQTTLVWRKCFVPQLYQFRRVISGGAALQYLGEGGLRSRLWNLAWNDSQSMFRKYLRFEATFRYCLARTNPESWYWPRLRSRFGIWLGTTLRERRRKLVSN